MKGRIFTTGLTTIYLILASALLVSCKEENNSIEEFPDWKNRNEAFFDQIFESALSEMANGNGEWKVFRNWSLSDEEDYVPKTTDHIVVKVIKDGHSANPAPLYNDTVHVSYCGRLLPSTSYANGKIFDDKMGEGDNPLTFTYIKGAADSYVDGFSTALQNIRVGDLWRVYIPWQLGYGQDGASETVNKEKRQLVPGYSTLVFDVYLKAYFHPGQPAPDVQAKTTTAEWIE